MKQKFQFLCGNFEKINFIYAIKFDKHPWHYFEEAHSISAVHDSLPAVLDSLIGTLDKVRTIEVPLDEEQFRNYYENGKFIFKEKELKSFLQLGNVKQSGGESSKAKSKNTNQLIFISGQTNPLFFLNEFEKCQDLKTDKDKMFKIRNFVDDPHRVEFSEFFFTSDWPTVRQAFLKRYSRPFTANKKKELNIDFNEDTSLRSFVERKLNSLATYTTLSFVNQVEMVLYDLPNEISNLFMINEKMTSNKTELLEFCDSIQDLVQTMREVPEKNPTIQDPLNQMEIFDFDPDLESDELQSMPSSRGNGRGSISKSGEYDFSDSQSSSSGMIVSEPESMAVVNSPQSVRGRTRRGSKGITAVRGGIAKRGRPRKNLMPIQEDSECSVLDYLNQMSDASCSTRSTRTAR